MGLSMPCGQCPVCDEVADLADSGICKQCGQAFCWNDCGGWHNGEHACFNCAPEDQPHDD